MDSTFGIDIPETLEEICAPSRAALLVYDLQVGIVSQISGGDALVERVATLVRSARAAGLRIVYTRHYNVPLGWAGTGQLRMAKSWQRVRTASELKQRLMYGSPGVQIAQAVAPHSEDVVLDKVTLSAFESTPLTFLLRDLGICSVLMAGIALEVGLEPTARHAADLGFVPVLVQDAIGFGNAEAARRSLAALQYSGDSVLTDLRSVLGVLPPGGPRSPEAS
jgi:biuret amidohydrolase